MPTRSDGGADETMPTRVPPIKADENSAGSPSSTYPEYDGPVATGSTTPVRTQVAPSPVSPLPAKKGPVEKLKGNRRWPWVLLGLALVFVLGGAGTWLGYRSAIQMRLQSVEEQKVKLASQQFMAGLVAQQNKQYDIARQQFEYVIRLDPNFPGAADKLREVLTAQLIAQTPTPVPTVPTPTMTPTRDLRPMEDIFNQAKQQYANKDWDNLFATIDTLRTMDPSFHAVELDGMMYYALRFRGVDKILVKANLEGGLYDLALSERYGPLDVDALGYRNWARLYLSGASFWDVDWLRVVNAFEQVYPYFPNLRDGSGMTAVDRYRTAARNYGDQLVQRGDACGSLEYYSKSLNAMPDNVLVPTATAAYLLCYPPVEATATPQIEMTPTVPAGPTPTKAQGEPPTATQAAPQPTQAKTKAPAPTKKP